MGSRDAEHTQWNLDHGLKVNEHLPLVCPRCAKPHTETLTNDPSQPDYFHHVHQCTHCGLRFELYVRTRSTHDGSVLSMQEKLAIAHRAIEAARADPFDDNEYDAALEAYDATRA